MTVDEFIAWAMAQPGGRYELLGGEVQAMSPERVGHARTKARVWRELDRAVGARGLACEALPDGLTVPIDETTSYEPDVLVRCGEPLDPDAVKVTDPVIVVEVGSRSTRGLDVGMKLSDYFKLPSVAHYLLIDTSRRVVTHHVRHTTGGIRTSIHRDGALRLDPPGSRSRLRLVFPMTFRPERARPSDVLRPHSLASALEPGPGHIGCTGYDSLPIERDQNGQYRLSTSRRRACP